MSTMATPRSLNKARQFLAILRKNFILQTRGRRSLLGIGGWAGLLLQLLLPVSFFLVMYLPKYYFKSVHHDESLGARPQHLESRFWAQPYDGPGATFAHQGRASLLLTPNTTEVRGLALVLARTLACPRDPNMRRCPTTNLPASFHCMFMPPYNMYDTTGTNSSDFDTTTAAGGASVAAATPAVAAGGEGEGIGDEFMNDSGGDLGGLYGTSDTQRGGGDGGDGGDGVLLQRLGSWWRLRQRQRRRLHPQLRSVRVPGSISDGGGGGRGGGVEVGGGDSRKIGNDDDGDNPMTRDQGATSDACTDFSTCISSPACYEHVLQNQISFMDSLETARHATVIEYEKWDAVVHFPRAAAAADAAANDNANKKAQARESTVAGQQGQQRRHDAGGADGGDASHKPPASELLSTVVVAMNHSDVPPTKFLLDLFEVTPTQGNGLALYKRYWFLANLQLAINRAVIGIHVAANVPPPPSSWPPSSSASDKLQQDSENAYDMSTSVRHDVLLQQQHLLPIQLKSDKQAVGDVGSLYDNAVPANVEVWYKAFPWPAVTEDLGAAFAAVFFQLLLVYAFLPSTRAVVADIVREKELRLREGMRVLGLSEPSYWLSWGLTHWLLLALSGALCTAAGTYPFANSSTLIMLTFFWLYGAALVSYSYCLSTLFSSSRVAGTAVQLLYALSMLPGFVLPVAYQYGSWTWYAACLAPPSAATLYATALVNWEKVAEGIRPSTLGIPITQANGFCAATVLWMLALDVVLYAMLTWYLDKVLPKSYGQRLPWWFVFDRRYWAARGGGKGSSRSSSGSGGSAGDDENRGTDGGGTKRRVSWGRFLTKLKARRWNGADDGGVVSSATIPLLGTAGSVTTKSDTGGSAGRSHGDELLEAAVLPICETAPGGAASSSGVAVEVHGLVKVFQTLTGNSKVAVDHLDLQIESGRITALLGHNGAGKTTTIHILTGMLQPTAGTATVNGFDVATQMDQVRASLGICPQFDILWPDLTVYEHLELYGAIKGYRRDELPQAANAAAESVGLMSKMSCPAGELSGGQRRKLSVAIAFLGDPAVVFLDEPTSGMDPYSRRFTWEVIRRHRSGAAIVLTTHSMEEADLLGDRVVIMAQGRVAAEGTGMELKANYGVGYNLTLVIDSRQLQPSLVPANRTAADPNGGDRQQQQHEPPPQPSQQQLIQPIETLLMNDRPWRDEEGLQSSTVLQNLPQQQSTSAEASVEAAVMVIVLRHVPTAELISAAGAELVIRLPREAAGAFPTLLRELDGPVGRLQLGVASYGLSVTTLEEVFLSITAAAEQQADGGRAVVTVNGTTAASQGCERTPTEPSAAAFAAGAIPSALRRSAGAAAAAVPGHPTPLHGWRLYGQQMRALFTKRALCAKRDRLAVLTQLAVPLALVYLALWVSDLQVRENSERPLELSRRTALFGRPMAWSATPAVRNATEGCSSSSRSSGSSSGSSGSSCLAAFLAGHPAGGRIIDTGATGLYEGDPRVKLTTLESYLLSHWYGGSGPVYDALHVTGLPPPATVASPWSYSPNAAAPPPPLSFVLLTNQSAISALPAALSEAMTAAWSYINSGLPLTSAASTPDGGGSGGSGGGNGAVSARGSRPPSFSAVSWPLPILESEPLTQIKHDAASLMLVLCLVLASSVLSASFVVFLVREQDNNSKHLQLVSGAPSTAYWAANYGWDMLSYSLSAAGLLALIASYRLPQYSGKRLAAVSGLLWGFGPAGISLTYLLHFLFKDEMRALQRLNTAYFLTGYLGFLATWICDLIVQLRQFTQPGSLGAWNDAVKWALRTASPHYCFARGMYDVQSTYDAGFPFGPRGKPFDWEVFGSPMAHMGVQTLVYGGFAVLYDAGFLTTLYVYAKDALYGMLRWMWEERTGTGEKLETTGLRVHQRGWWTGGGWWDGEKQRRRQQQHGYFDGGVGGDVDDADGIAGGTVADAIIEAARLRAMEEATPLLEPATAGAAAAAAAVAAAAEEEEMDDVDEDVDVAAEKRAVISGLRNNCQVLLNGVRKSYSQGLFRPAVAAVRGLWVGVPAGECFGLLGVNGAGKTTTFRMLTGEVLPDAGDARVGGFSVRTQLAAARRQLGYCPQFEALPGAMTGQEVVAMYARLRGVPEPYVADLASYLLRRLGLEAAAHNACSGYSGGMKRKLGVAVALVGDPRVCALDEPSTGMDPGARRGLWTCLQNEVIRAGRTVVLTSHSMEECEALCTRLTILVGGRQRCLGTVQHLKSRFGGGYVLEIKTLPCSSSSPDIVMSTAGETAGAVQPPRLSARPLELSPAVGAAVRSSADGDDGCSGIHPKVPAVETVVGMPVNHGGTDAATTPAALAAWVASICPGAVLSRVDENRFTFAIPRAGAEGASDSPFDLAALFEAVESNRTALGVVDYCLTQTTLEQLFVSIAGASTADGF